jgi:peptidoglycan/xylan/chitin deacetylase (PgdA/CDA1 family)
VIGSVRGECIQIPTTLPTLDELIGTDGLTADTACDELRARTRASQLPDQVFTAHAELEGGQLAPQFERLLRNWAEDGFTLVPLRDLAADLHRELLPRHVIAMGSIPGRSGVLALQAQRVSEPAGK